jgi:hypothetical protein
MKHSSLLVLASLALLPACKPHYSLPEFDALARTAPVRTIVLEEGFSLYSPYDVQATREYVTLVATQKAEVFGLLEVESAEPLVVHLSETEELGASFSVVGDRLQLERLSSDPHDGFLGWAGEELVVRVAPARKLRREDGSELTGLPAASMYRDTLRHELAHLATRLAGIRGTAWLNEGIAHALEWIPVEAGRFVLDPLPPPLDRVTELERAPGELAELLAWEQGYPATDVDRRARLVGLALVLFLHEREAAPSLAEGLRRIAALAPQSILALEPEWRAWVADLATRAR